VVTTERWYIGTIISLSIDRRTNGSSSANESITLQARVVRYGGDGLAVQFVGMSREQKVNMRRFLAGLKTNNSEGVQRVDVASASGNSLVEFALILPLLLLLVVNTVNFGGFIYGWIVMANAARTGAQYMIMGGAGVGAPASPTPTQIIDLITADTTALLNNTTVAVCVSKNNNGVITANGDCTGANSSPAAAESGGEAANFVMASVDVRYTYQPYISLWSFPGLGIRSTLPPTSVHRRAVMRMIQ